MFTRIIEFLTYPWTCYKIKRDRQKRLEEMRKKDPGVSSLRPGAPGCLERAPEVWSLLRGVECC